MTIQAGGALEIVSGGSVQAGSINNAGVLRLKGTANVNAGAGLVNTGTLDLIEFQGTLPAGFGTGAGGSVLDANSVQITSVSKAFFALTVTLNAYAGHTYTLQGNSTLSPSTWTDESGTRKTPTTNGPLTMSTSSGDAQRFLRVRIGP